MKRLLMGLFAVLLLAPLIAVTQPAVKADAANAALWNPGNIISDALFFDGGAMNADAVQAFLNSQGGGIRNYTVATQSLPADRYCGAYNSQGVESAAQIIAKVGAACGISQRVLIVLLQKEQSLITLSNPSETRYNYATGFNCPDTAPCSGATAGFFKQVYAAARQFQVYVQNPNSFNYQAGRYNNILYNPDGNCGYSSVYIENRATAALYIYTPYQPNASALANLYGTGDYCGAYGNRNFWRLWTDWFGNPGGAAGLVRSVENSSVYLVNDTTKYPVTLAVLATYAPLGAIGYVSQSYLDSLATGQFAGRLIRDTGGTIYFTDAGIKLGLSSCQQAVDYGGSCANDGYVQLTASQAALFHNGPVLSNILGTTAGARYWIHGGQKSEILDDAAQAAAGITGSLNVLTENAVAHLPFGDPIVRDGVFAGNRSNGGASLLLGGVEYPMNSAQSVGFGVSTRTVGALWQGSLDAIADAAAFTGVVAPDSNPSAVTILSSSGRLSITGGGFTGLGTALAVPQSILDSYADGVTIAPGSFIKAPDSGTIYVVMPNDIRPIGSWDALLALSPDPSRPTYFVLPSAIIAAFQSSVIALTSGTLVRSASDATVYLINGVTNKIALSSFSFVNEAGFSNFSFAPQDRIDAYPKASQLAGFAWQCGSDVYLGAGGQLHRIDAALLPLYPFASSPVALDSFVCAKANVGAAATAFIRTSDGSIYLLDGGTKRPIGSMATYAGLAAGSYYLNVSDPLAWSLPTGSPVL